MSIVRSPSVQLSFETQSDANRGVIGLHNLVNTSNVTATSFDSSNPATNLANPATYLDWRSLVTSEQFLTVSLNGDELVDYVGLARHNFGTISAPLSIEGYTETDSDGPVWEELVGDFIPVSDASLLLQFEAGYYLGIRVRIQSTFIEPRCAVMYVGKLLALQRNIYVGHTPIVYGRESRIINGMSEAGEFLGRIVLAESLSSSISLKNLTPSWYRSQLDPVISQMKETPFFYAWRPYTYPAEVAYGWVTNNPRPVNELNNGMMSISLDLGGIA
ncbi:MAG: hypothetical protein AB7Q00_14485 [Phycisphaerales bacterium]